MSSIRLQGCARIPKLHACVKIASLDKSLHDMDHMHYRLPRDSKEGEGPSTAPLLLKGSGRQSAVQEPRGALQEQQRLFQEPRRKLPLPRRKVQETHRKLQEPRVKL